MKGEVPILKTVFVVMGNDFPDSVFSSEAAAEEFCRLQRPNSPRIYWRVYPFRVDDKAPEIIL